MPNVIYTAYFLDNPLDLLQKIPVKLVGTTVKTYAHHVTVEYMPKTGIQDLRIGTKITLIAYAQAGDDSVQAVLVRSSDESTISTNTHPHVTIATAHGAAPNDSNSLIKDAIANNTVENFESPIVFSATLGYFDGQHVITQ